MTFVLNAIFDEEGHMFCLFQLDTTDFEFCEVKR